MPPPGSDEHPSPVNPSTTPSPVELIDRPSSSSRLSRDSEGYPSWLPKRPPPPAPASTFQSSNLGGLHDQSPSPVEPTPPAGGRKPTPRSVRIVSLQDSFVGAVEKETRFRREPTDQTRVGVPPKVWTRATGVPPTAFNASEQDGFLPLPQPRFNAKNLHLQILRNPSRWMKLYFYVWPLLVFYHIPLQTFFDFNAVFILLQVAKYPNPLTSGKNWALGAAAYIACWLVWIFVVCIVYELIYSFTRRWRLRRPLMLPIYLSSPAFNYAALISYANFSFLQHLRYTGFFPEPAPLLPPNSPSDPDYDFDDLYDDNRASWKSGIAETCYFYSQNLPTVALLLPRAGLCLALLFAFSSAPAAVAFVTDNSSNLSRRDQTFFREDGSLSGYARGILIANAAWTAWRVLVLSLSWFGLWILSNQRLAGLCGPRHTWDENEQEKTRSVYSEAASEYGAYRGSFYHPGDAGPAEYGGDELPWEWREATRMRVQDAFEFCIASRGTGSGSSGALRWATAPGVGGVAPTGNYTYRDRRYRKRHSRRRSAKGKEPSNEKDVEHVEEEPFEGLEKVLAAVGFPSTASPARRGVLTEDLFTGPASTSASAQPREQHPSITPLQYEHQQPKASGGMFTGLETPKMAKRNSKDKIPGSSGAGPLMSLPYPFSKPGAGHVSSKDSVPFPATKSASKKSSGTSGKSSKSGASKSPSSASSGTGSGSGSGSGSVEEEDEDEEDDEDDEDEDEDEDDEEEDGDVPSERPSSGSGRASASMSSLGQPVSAASRYPFGARRPTSAGHGRSPSGVSSGMSSGPGPSGGSHAHSHSIGSHGTRMSILTQSTGNHESTDSEFGAHARQRASLSQGSSNVGRGVIPMPPRHPHPQTNGRGRAGTVPASTSAAAAHASMLNTPIAFPSVRQRQRVDSGRGIPVDPSVLYGEGIGSDIENQYDFDDDDDDEEEEEEEEAGEQGDHVGLLGVPSSSSRVSLANSASSGSRSPTHSSFSIHSSNRSRHSSTQARSRSRPHSSHSVRERASSLGASMRSLMQGATASLTQLELVMRGATGPAAGLGGLAVGSRSRPRSRVNSSMARLEEDVVFSLESTELEERRGSRAASAASGGGSQNGSGSGSHGGGEVLAHPAAAALREAEEAEGYYSSSGGTHSRSGSESLSTENYTFGRPMLFMKPAQPQARVEEEDEMVAMERSPGTAGLGSPSRTRPASITGGEPQSVSVSVTESFYSADPSQRTVSPMAYPRSEHSPSPATSIVERQGIDIPRNQQRLLAPPGHRWVNVSHQPHDAVTSNSDSPPDISTAAGSFVTAAATLEGGGTTESSGPRTVPSSWETSAPALGARLRDTGGMVERPGDDMGASGDAWRVV